MICLAVSTQYRCVTDRLTDILQQHNQRYKRYAQHRAVKIASPTQIFTETVGCWLIAKKICNMAAVRHLEFKNFSDLVTWLLSSSKSAVVHQISSKSDDSSLRYGDLTSLKMSAVRHVEFSKFGVYVTWPLSHAILFFMQNFTEIGQAAAELWPKKQFAIWRPYVRHHECQKFSFWSCLCHRVPNLLLCTKFHDELS